MAPPIIPSKMKGLLLEKFVEGDGENDPYSFRKDIDFDASNLKPTDVVIKIAVAGICHTDQMVVRGEMERFLKDGLPLVPSHEPAGVVVAMGSEASSSKSTAATGGERALAVGDRVGSLPPKDFCGQCPDCQAGRFKYCDKPRFLGISDRQGGLAEYMIADYRSVVVLPDSMPFETSAPLMCAGATIYTAIKDCRLKAGQHLCIIGAGALGHIGCQIAKCQGLKVSVIDARDPPLKLCQGLPHAPDATFNSGKVDAESEEDRQSVVEAIGGEPDATIVTAEALSAFTLGIWITKKHGHLQVVAQPKEPIQIPFYPLIFRDLKVTGSLIASQGDLKELVDLVADKGIEVRTRAYPLEEVPSLLRALHEPGHAGKLVVRVSDEQ
ncbi:unnamed protein product [Parajaminaea phylloscopi]